ncbi:Uncharacterized protein OS=Rhodopirellula baltica SWK14 GN=RBSWK_05112 PE=4 SV=1: DUF669 [Gemmata massiliana]|uniref:Uncharacterized protein n=1 Tax=Gemmata massiliana TaxID=1210884 RepID=A0A6P2CX86_9BACT|nr:hypothetical protein [Gemmata massiliana]VTR92755.1 Uncharacterized protein OS=Rhodopirellula baltica SWK14 GN=RBSWK_05112 PE=4 SV=1: DUF669 [Gemmata massiliana]
MTTPRKPLTGILPGGNGASDDIFDRFDATEAADDFGPLPKGVFVALAIGGKLDKARTGTDGYTIEFRVLEGEYTGRRLWVTKYFTPAALPYTKRDLAKLGIDSTAKLRQPFPANRLVCKLTVTLRRDDDGTERNEVKNLDVIRVQEPTADPFAPSDPAGAAGTDAGTDGGPNP